MIENILNRNNVTITGEGTQPLMLAHGFGCDQNIWRYITPALEEDYKIILFDYVGSGKSDISAYNRERYGSLDGYAKDILDIIEAIDLENVTLIGHSVSSITGALASIEKPEYFCDLIMIGPSPCYLNDPPDYYGGYERKTIEELLDLMEKNYIGWANMFSSQLIGGDDQEQAARKLKESFCSTDPVIARQFAKITFLGDNREDLSKIEVPVLILQSENDSIAPLRVGKYVDSNIPHSTLNVLPTYGHCPHLTHPDLTIEAIKNYMTKSASV